MTTFFTRICSGVAGLIFAGAATASTVVYDWVNQSGPVDSGSMTFTLTSGTPGDFTGATLSAFTFTFANGTVATLGTAGVAVTSLASPGWSAGTNGASSLGYLTSVAEITNSPHTVPVFTFQFQPYAGQSTGIDQASSGTSASYGVWQEAVSPVPLPGDLAMLALGMTSLLAFGARKTSQRR